MSDYKNIIGKGIRFVSSNLDNDQAEGQIWYNSTDGAFKNLAVSEAWASSGPLGTGRYAMSTGTGGTVDAGIAVFGRATTGATEEYNGNGWAVGGTGGTARYSGAKFGTQTAEVAAGGKASGTTLQNVEEYDGSSWSEVNNYPSTSRGYLSGFGILTAGVICGGVTASPDTWYSLTEEYDGTNWTTGGALNNARATAGTTGILTAGLVFGGYSPSLLAKTEEYNGTAWTESGDMSTARNHVAGSGTQDAALAYGGLTPSATTQTEAYNGSTWSTSPATLATATARNSSVGSAASTGLSFGGNPPGTTASEEYNKSINVITAGAWAAGDNLNLTRSNVKGGGTQTAAVGFGGQTPPSPAFTVRAETEEYDGSSWTESGDMSNARREFSGFGTQGAAVAFGGENPGDTQLNATENYNGSSWTAGGNYPVEISLQGSAGTQTAGLGIGGADPSSPTNLTCEYDGSTWTSTAPGGNLGTSRYGLEGAGTQTAAVAFGGSPPRIGLTEEYDGSSWTTGNNMNRKLRAIGGAGTQTAALSFGGAPGDVTSTEGYDGTSWATKPNMASGRSYLGGCGTQTLALAMGNGSTPTAEEFTGETSALNVKTITTS
jgi:hypothetical protein